ncbi:unnamed protein product [Rhizoctonia solani]|uniref:Uncharacterized protein n=1 Tax=Rhizoctonia solani TaxID=456999 RepID=A0A8H2WVG2_9AGAM|nr:unnamed protein product [Rhizoctonia solani]
MGKIKPCSGGGSKTYRSRSSSQMHRGDGGSQRYRSDGGDWTYHSDGGSQAYHSDEASPSPSRTRVRVLRYKLHLRHCIRACKTGRMSSIEASSDTISPSRPTAPNIGIHVERVTPSTIESIPDAVSPPNLIALALRGEAESTHMSSVASTVFSTISPPDLTWPGQRPSSFRSRRESISSIMSGSTAMLPGLIFPASHEPSTVRPGSLPSVGSISPMSNLPLQHPGLQVPSATSQSRSVFSKRPISVSIPSMRPLMLSRSSVHSALSPSISLVSLNTTPCIRIGILYLFPTGTISGVGNVLTMEGPGPTEVEAKHRLDLFCLRTLEPPSRILAALYGIFSPGSWRVLFRGALGL